MGFLKIFVHWRILISSDFQWGSSGDGRHACCVVCGGTDEPEGLHHAFSLDDDLAAGFGDEASDCGGEEAVGFSGNVNFVG